MDIKSFADEKEKIRKRAFLWAVSEQKRLECVAEPIRLVFNRDCFDKDVDGCVASIFYDEETNKAILRRDWFDDMAVCYNIITNLEEIKKNAPKSASHLLDNGIKLFFYFDGQNGGITKKVNKEWRCS